jgi:G3E family GTPase
MPVDLIIDGHHGAVPITILTGFLGAGKTTLLNHVLTGDHGRHVGVLVNDFGSVNVDAELVVGVDQGAISLANGCVCCEIRDDLVESVLTLLERPEPVDHILLEASGVADPGGIFMTFSDCGLREAVRLDGVICVVDAEQVFAHPEYPPLLDLKLRQVGFSDMIILNKVCLAGPQQVEVVRSWLDHHFNRLRIIETNYCDVPGEVLIGSGRFDPCLDGDAVQPPEPAREGHNHELSGMFSTRSYENLRPMKLDALREAMRTLPGAVYRVKGFVYCVEVPQRRVVLQVVGRRVDLSVHDPWDRRVPRTQLVAIGAPGAVDECGLDERLVACEASTSPNG